MTTLRRTPARTTLAVIVAIGVLTTLAATGGRSADATPLVTEPLVPIDVLLPAERDGTQIQISPPPPRPPTRVLFVSDSSFAGIRWSGNLPLLEGAIFDNRLESCRRLIGSSCRGREGYVPPTALEEVLSAPRDAYDVLVVGTGYNDYRVLFAPAFDQMMAAARDRGIDRVVWITYREQVSYTSPFGASNAATFAANNAHLRQQAASGLWPELVLADWHTYSFNRWSWVASDGVHLTTIGGREAAVYVTRTLAHLDGRPCPPGVGGPTTTGGICARPDVTGPA